MPTRNVSDLQLWWSHPNYTPTNRNRVRNRLTELGSGAAVPPGSVFRMDSSYSEIDDLTLPSFIGEVFRIKEHMGIGQNRPRRTFVNVRDVKEGSGTFTCNFGVADTPEQFFKAVRDDPGANGDGQKRPLTLYGVINSTRRYVDTGTASAHVNGVLTLGADVLEIDDVTNDTYAVGDRLKIQGDNTLYEIIAGEDAPITSGDGAGGLKISPPLQKATTDELDVTKWVMGSPRVLTWEDGNVADFVLAEFDYTPEVDGELMGAFTLQAAGTGYQNVRA